MNINRKTLVLATLAAMALWTTSAVAQNEGAGSETAIEQDSPQYRFQKDDRLISQLLRNPDTAPLSLRQELVALRESQMAIRTAWIEDYRPGDNATAEEIKAARELFQSDYSEQIQASKELRRSLMQELRSGLRDAIDDSAWNEEARAIYAEYKQNQEQLGEAWRAARAELGADATREEIKAAKERFNEANADLIAQQKELAKQVRELIRENRSERLAQRDEVPQELLDLRADMDALRSQVRARQRQAREDMRNLSRAEREEYRRNLLDELKELHDEIKERRRQVIDEIQDGQTGDRRPEG